MIIPENIRRLIGSRTLQTNTVGLSGAGVYCMDDMVLKVEHAHPYPQREAAMMAWLKGRLPAPQLLGVEQQDGMQYLLMSRVPGEMLCAPYWLERPNLLLERLAEALHMLRRLPTEGCPMPMTLDQRLLDAEARIAAGLCRTDNVEPGTYGPGGFASPEALLHWLRGNRPDEELSFIHGDLCLPNVFATAEGITGFIDLGSSGVADAHWDMALCLRSLSHNMDGTFGAPPVDGFAPQRLFDVLGITPDKDKMRYYYLLDELF